MADGFVSFPIGQAIPRNHIKESEKREELTSPGVYFLFGYNETIDRQSIYIGEAENAITRLKQHLAKDNWNEVIVFISKDSNLNKAHIKYLENRFHSIAKDCNRYSLDNSSTPTKSTISEAEQAELEEFIHNAKILVNALGHKVFEHYTDTSAVLKKDENIFYVAVDNEKASGMPTSDGFVLLKGSYIHQTAASSLTGGTKRKVEESRLNGEIENNIIQQDKLFSSSSAAAAFATGYSISGPQQWKTKEGKTLKQFETEVKN